MTRGRLTAALGAVAAAAAIVVGTASCGGGNAHRPPAATNARPAAATGTPPTHSFVVYGKAKRAQFVNHADDRARGDKLLKTFNADGLPTPANANSGKKGARAGDNALISIVLYADRNLTRVVGSATYSCTFNFSQEAVCDGQFQIGAGTLIALGPAKLDGSAIVLAVTGGTGRYADAHGQVTSSSATSKNTQIFRFDLV
jgi:hypothetical protein